MARFSFNIEKENWIQGTTNLKDVDGIEASSNCRRNVMLGLDFGYSYSIGLLEISSESFSFLNLNSFF